MPDQLTARRPRCRGDHQMCTSLGLGAMQLNAGLNYMSTTWGTGVQIADNSDSHVVIVLGITLIATTSVVTGLRQGLKHLSILAMVLCLIVLLTVTLAGERGRTHRPGDRLPGTGHRPRWQRCSSRCWCP